jgi:hypothetical protein
MPTRASSRELGTLHTRQTRRPIAGSSGRRVGTPATPTSDGDLEKATDRAHAWRNARLAFAGALLAAMIGWGSAFIAAYFNDVRSVQEFLRTQRQQLYAEYVGTSNEINEHIDASFLQIPNFDAIKRTDDSLDRLEGLNNQIALIGGPSIREAADNLYRSFEVRLQRGMYDDYCRANPQDATFDICQRYEEPPFDLTRDYLVTFIEEARRELQVN